MLISNVVKGTIVWQFVDETLKGIKCKRLVNVVEQQLILF